jgi:hypothetical protein
MWHGAELTDMAALSLDETVIDIRSFVVTAHGSNVIIPAIFCQISGAPCLA